MQTPKRMAGILLLLGALVSQVRAQTPAEVPPGAPPVRFLMLGFSENTALSPVLRDAVAKDILDRQLGVVLRPELSPNDLGCLKASCLEDLATQWNDADYIVGGAVLKLPEQTKYEGQAWLYKIHATEEQKRLKQRQISRTEPCTEDADLLNSCVSHIVTALITELNDQLAQARQQALIKSRRPVPCARWNFARAATLGAASALMLEGLVAGSIAAARPQANLIATNLNTVLEVGVAPGIAGFGDGSAGVAVIPAALALLYPKLFFPGRSPDPGVGCAVTPATRWTASRGAAVGVFSGLLVSTATLAIMLSTSLGVTEGAPPMPANASSPTAPLVGPAWGVAGVWVVGLGLSLILPGSGTIK